MTRLSGRPLLTRPTMRHSTADQLPSPRLSGWSMPPLVRPGSVVQFHAVIRLDGPAGPNTAPPAWATIALLTGAID